MENNLQRMFEDHISEIQNSPLMNRLGPGKSLILKEMVLRNREFNVLNERVQSNGKTKEEKRSRFI